MPTKQWLECTTCHKACWNIKQAADHLAQQERKGYDHSIFRLRFGAVSSGIK